MMRLIRLNHGNREEVKARRRHFRNQDHLSLSQVEIEHKRYANADTNRL